MTQERQALRAELTSARDALPQDVRACADQNTARGSATQARRALRMELVSAHDALSQDAHARADQRMAHGSVAQAKRTLRAEFAAARDALPQDLRARADQRILRKLTSLSEWAAADRILCYLSMGTEVDTRAIIRAAWSEGRQVYAPRCATGRSMVWHRIESFDGLVRSRFGVFEPQSGAEWDPASPNAGRSLAIVPGLAFDRQGYRLGYGGGYYDRFLAYFPGTSVGVVRTAQLVDDLAALGAVEPHDLPVHHVISG